ncbi:hypothetical protein [Embleya sp. NPDC005971]|uniref:hypothetical protein n=1 Tax=unclassified Embleya TaxID=2699296 RepID=UPI0033C232C5
MSGRLPAVVALTDTGRRRHEERKAFLLDALHTSLGHLDTDAVDTASEVPGRLVDIYDRL